MNQAATPHKPSPREEGEFQRGHDVGYSAGLRDGMQARKNFDTAAAQAARGQGDVIPPPIKIVGGRPEAHKTEHVCWLGHRWGHPDDAATEQEVRQVAVTVSILVSMPRADDCCSEDFVRAAVDAIQRAFPHAAILLDNDTKHRALNPMVDGGYVTMSDVFCKSLEERHDAQSDFAARFGGGA